MHTYAADLAELVQKLDLQNAVHAVHSTGGGEVARYIAHYGTKRVAKAVLIASVPPLMVKTAANLGGTPISVFDENRAGVVADRAQFFKDFSLPFSETDQTEDLKKFNVPTLIIQGDDDQVVPFAHASLLQSKLIKGATLKVYKGAPHGLCTTQKENVNANLLAFLKT